MNLIVSLRNRTAIHQEIQREAFLLSDFPLEPLALFDAEE